MSPLAQIPSRSAFEVGQPCGVESLAPSYNAPGGRDSFVQLKSIMDPIAFIEQRLAGIEEILFVYLFGSRAGASARPDSDWDLGIYLAETLSARERFDLRRRLACELEELGQVDLVVLNEAPPLLAHRALTGRRLLVRDKPALVRFFVKTMGLSEDDRHWGKIHQVARRERLEKGRFGRL